ncbi:putative quinol monooxygenase [Dactylosporangium sp. McL0621]|uniref:putative quinol monooxygenase n=1 Tax=Dactylosporangium sp. McL0621 TaxID=3415678 RepID=UPI003CF4E5A1
MSATHGFHATMTAQPGKGDELVELLLNAPSMPNEDCVVFLVGRSAGDPDTVFVTEGWTSQEAHSRFFATEEAQALCTAAGWSWEIASHRSTSPSNGSTCSGPW